MADDYRDDDEEFEGPDWMEETEGDDLVDRLRHRSTRTGSMNEDILDVDDGPGRSSSAFSLNNFTPGQRLVLALLVFLNILAIGFGFLVLTGYF